MTIADIYSQYKIMPQLQLHMLRVAGVATLITDNLPQAVDKDSIVSACLLHDMGNIIKFDLELFPEFSQAEGKEYWQNVQAEFVTEYGTDVYQANLRIAEEVGVSEKVLALIEAIGFAQMKTNFEEQNLEKMICEYADCRVAPQGVVSLTERLADLEQRYGEKYPGEEESQKRLLFADFARQTEQYIFEKCTLTPEELTEDRVFPTLEALLLQTDTLITGSTS